MSRRKKAKPDAPSEQPDASRPKRPPAPATDRVVAKIGPAKPPRRRPQGRRQEPRNAPPTKIPKNPDIPLHLIDRDALEVVRRLRRFGHKAYLVGGCVRDLMLGLTPKDFDVSTDAKPEEIKAVFRNSRIIGRRFRLAHVYFRGGKVIETATFRGQATAEEGEDLLIVRDNIFGTEEEDAIRRDFTINGLFYDVESGKIIDHVGGIDDLDKRYVRMIGDPDIRLREDPVRIIRAVRFAAKGDLQLDPALLESMKAHRQEIFKCSKPRLLEETFKLLRGGHAEHCIRIAHETEVLDVIFPELLEHLDSLDPHGEEITVYNFLAGLDRLVKRQGVSDSVVLGALISLQILHIQERNDPSKHARMISQYIDDVSARIGATRRMNERLRQIFVAQRSLMRTTEDANAKRTRRKMAPSALARRTYFQDALDLFEIQMFARGLAMDDVRFWRELGRNTPTDPEESESEGRGGGRRRSRRRRPRRSGDGESKRSEQPSSSDE